jgi:hypothetical protein
MPSESSALYLVLTAFLLLTLSALTQQAKPGYANVITIGLKNQAV